jgi:signal transduction histidine kinase
MLEEAAELARTKAADSQVRIELAVAPDVGLIRADAKRIRQVLFSLTGIAMRSVGPGDTITLGARRLEDSVRLWVEDTGPRLPDQELAGAFKAFDDRTRRGGIPLALVTRFVEMHGGWTSVAAGRGGGTVVSCRLPVEAAAQHAAPELDLAS